MGVGDGTVLGATQIHGAEPVATAFNIVVLAEGFTSAQQTAFNTACTSLVATLLATPPFGTPGHAFNVFRVNVASTQSGADDPIAASPPGTGAVVATYFDATFGFAGLRRLLVCDTALALSVALAQVPEFSVALVMVNSTIYGGSGGGVAVFSLASGASEIAIHEMGHTAFGLADEYSVLAGGVEPGQEHHPGPEPTEPNVTLWENPSALKWAVTPGYPLPTMENPDCATEDLSESIVPAGTVGLFEGADTYHCDVYRPEYNCKMRALFEPFCAVCSGVIAAALLPDATTITIGGVDRTDQVAIQSFSLRTSIRDAGRLTFHTNDRISTISGYRPALFDAVVVVAEGVTLFNGTITRVNDAPVVSPRIGTRVTCEATAAAILDRLLVDQDYHIGPHPILNSAISSPTSLTVVNHGFVTGQLALIEDHQASTPAISGVYVVTAQGPNNLSIPVNVTVAGGGGTIRRVMTLHEIVSDLRNQYLSSEIAWDASNPTGPVLEAPIFDNVTVRAAFSALQGLSGYVIRVLPTNMLQLFAPGAQVASYSLTAANGLDVTPPPLTWVAQVGQYANTLVLKYGTEVQTPKTAIFTGTGALNNWTLEYDPVLDASGFIVSSGYVDESGAYLPIGLLAEIVSSAATGDIITTTIPHGFDTGATIIIQGHTGSTPAINGTHTITVLTSHTFSIPVNITVGGTGGTCYAPGLTWNYWPPANQMFRTAPLASGAVATFVYTVQFPQVLTVQDAPEVALHGVWETQRTVTTIFDAPAAAEWGAALLRRLKAQTIKTVTIATRKGMPHPGDMITLTYPDKSVSGSHLLTEISGTADADKRMRWTFTAAAGTEVIDDWMDLLRDTIGSGSGSSVIGGGGVVSGGYIPPTSGGGGGGTGGGTGATGTIGTLAMFNTPTTLVSSIVSQSGTTITVAGNVVATHYTGSGAGLTSIPAEQLTGTIADARLSANIPRINASQIWTAAQRFNNGPTFFQGAAAADALRVLGRVADNMGRLSFYTADNVDLQGVIVGSGTGGAAKLGFGAASDVELLPNGNVILDPAANSVLPGTNYDINLGMLTRKYLTLHAAELWVETLVAQNTIATIGGRILVPRSTTVLTSDLASGATTILVKHNSLANGHRLIMEGNGQFECMFVTSGASGGGPYSYTVTRNEDGSGPAGGNNWIAGNAVVNTGTTGDGFIDIYAIAGVKSTSEEGPAIVGNVRQSATWNDWAPRWAIGNLNGVYGYSADTYGACFGNPAATNITIDATNGIRIRNSTTDKFSADTSGNLSLTGDLSIGTAGIFRTAGATAFATGIGIYMAGGATPVFRVGDPVGGGIPKQLSWDGSVLSVGLFTVDAQNFTAPNFVMNAVGLMQIGSSGTSDICMSMVAAGSMRIWIGNIGSPTTGVFQVNSLGTMFTTALQVGASGLLNVGPETASGANVITPAQITSDQNNYTPSGIAGARVMRLSSDASRTITGMAGTDGRFMTIINGGTNLINFPNVSGSSSAGNQFVTPGFTTFALGGGASVDMVHNSGFWCIIAQ